MTQKRFGSMGASSVLMIFVVLCLTAFGVLSLVSARADLRLTRRAVQAAEEYYAADAGTDALLGAVDNALAAARKETASGEDAWDRYLDRVAEAVAGIEGASMQGDSILLTASAGEQREIQTKLELLPLESPDRYRVISRRLFSTAGEDLGDDGINVWPGF